MSEVDVKIYELVALSLAVVTKEVTARTVDRLLSDVIKHWAREVFEGTSANEIPNVELSVFDVEALVMALCEP